MEAVRIRTADKKIKIGDEMRENLNLGYFGEQEACRYLKRCGYEILERNFRCRAGELDIVAKRGSLLCFVEVKTRRSFLCGAPGEAVDDRKRQHIKKAVQYYLLSHEAGETELRTDVIEIVVIGEKTYLRHIENIFLE